MSSVSEHGSGSGVNVTVAIVVYESGNDSEYGGTQRGAVTSVQWRQCAGLYADGLLMRGCERTRWAQT